jgi:tetratricopeptide (TPR) repeat protein
VKKLARASSQFNDQNPDVLVHLAQACERDRQTGEAAKVIRKLMALRPEVPAIKAELARIQLINGQTDKEALAESARLLDEVLKEDPANEAALRLHAGHLVMSGKKEEALKVFKQLEPDKKPDVAVNMARLYADLNQKAVGRELVEPYFQKDPKNLQLLQEMLRLADGREQALAYIKASRDAGASGGVLDLWEAQVSGDAAKARATLTEMVTGEDVKDPVVRHLNRFALLRQEGKTEEANQELEAAAKINPDHARLVDTRFELALQEQKWDQAESLAARAGRLGLDQAEGRFYFGRLELSRGRHDEAISSFRQGTQVRPVYAEGHRLLAEALRANNDHAAALAEYGVALEQQPGNVDVMRGMAVSLAALDRAGEALPMMRRAYEAAPNNPTVLNQYLAMEQQIGDPQRALELRQKIAAANPKDLANRRAVAVLLARLKRGEEALKEADALVAENPADLDSVGTAAGVRAVLGKKDEGRKLLQDYVNGRGDKATSNDWILFARYLLSVQDIGAATAAYGQAIALEDPKARPATRELADNLFGMREYKQAAEHYQKLYDLDPKDKRIAQRFVETLLRDSQLDRAEKVLSEHRAAAGDDGAVALLEAMLWSQRGEPDKALAAINRGLEKEPTRALLYLERARLQESDPAKSDAVFADLRKAVELDGNLAVAQLGLASAHVRRKENGEAIRVLEQLLEDAPQVGQARLMLVDLYLAAGQADRARAAVEDAQRLFPRDPAWARVAARLAMMDKKPEVAEKHLRQALGLSGAPQDFVTLADFLLGQKRGGEALKMLDEQPGMLGQSPLLQAMRGRALALDKKTEPADAAFVKAIGMAGDYASLQAVAAQMEQALGREAAVAMLDKHAAGAQQVEGQVLVAQLEAGGGKRQEAISRLQRIEGAVPAEDRTLYDRVLSAMLHQQGDYAGAAAVYKRLADNNPKELAAFNNLAYLLGENLNRPADALPYAEKAAELAPNDPQVLDTLGWVQFKAGKTDEAYNNLRRSVDSQVFAANTYHLAEVLLARDEKEGARQMFESAKRLAEQSKDQKIRDDSDKRLRELGL